MTRRRLSRREVFSSEHVPLYIRRHAQRACAAHSHDFVEVALVAAGAAVHRTARGDRRIGRGDAFLLRPGSWHAYHHCRGLEIYNCCFGTELLQRELAWVLEDPVLGRLLRGGRDPSDRCGVIPLHLPPEDVATCLSHLDALERLEGEDELVTRAERIGHLLLLLSALARGYRPATPSAAPGRAHPEVLRAMRMLEADICHDWSLRELAERLSLDPSYLVRLFKEVSGLPPMAYLTRLRAERAAYLLLRTDRLVSEVGSEVGWTDPNYFARRFRKYFGISPRAYRAAAVGGEAAAPPSDKHG